MKPLEWIVGTGLSRPSEHDVAGTTTTSPSTCGASSLVVDGKRQSNSGPSLSVTPRAIKRLKRGEVCKTDLATMATFMDASRDYNSLYTNYTVNHGKQMPHALSVMVDDLMTEGNR